jgi:hypothetical protein
VGETIVRVTTMGTPLVDVDASIPRTRQSVRKRGTSLQRKGARIERRAARFRAADLCVL